MEQRFDASLKGLDFSQRSQKSNRSSEVSGVKFDDVLSKVERHQYDRDQDHQDIHDVLAKVNDAFETFEERSKKRAQEASEAMVQHQILKQREVKNGFREINQDINMG